jgi:hypothetical protein
VRQIVPRYGGAVDAVDLSPEAFASLIAPAIDRVFRGGMRVGWERGGRELLDRHGGSETVGWLIEFRTALGWPGREVSPMGFATVTRYRDAGECGRSLAAAAERGALELTAAGRFRATERGHEFLRELYEHQATAKAEHWAGHEDRVEGLLEPVGRVLEAALAPVLDGTATNGRTASTAAGTGGGAFVAMAPPYEPAGTCPGVLLLNRLGTLRYHRADAHAAAWTAAGLTAAGVAEMAPGPERDAIEAETNRRAAPPFAALSAPERLAFLADLAALPG